MANDTDQVTKILHIKVDGEQAVKVMRELNNAIDDVKKQEKALSDEIKENEKTHKLSAEQIEEKKAQLAALKEAEKDYKAQLSEVSRVVQKELQADRSKVGSLKQLRAQLAQLTKQYDELSREERENAEIGGVLKQQINDITDELKGTEESTQRYFRNVGNYPEAVKPVTQAIREMTQELIEMKMRGEENTQAYSDLLQKVGQMKDAMEDTQREVKQMASDTGALNSVLDAGKLAAGGFSAALGIMNLVGDQDSETAKAMADAQRKLQAAIAVTTGLQAVQNALQKESALMMGINKVQIWAAAKAQDAYTAAVGRATIAQRIFNAVAKANPYVLLAMAIVTVVGAIAAFTSGSKEQEEQVKYTNVQLKAQADLLKEIEDGYKLLSKQTEKFLEDNIEWVKVEGGSIEEIRQAEDYLFEERQKNFDEERERLQQEIVNYNHWKDEYAKNLNLLNQLQERRLELLRKGDTEAAQFYQNEINNLQAVMDQQKKHIDLVDDLNDRYSAFWLARKKQLADREKEDEEAARRAKENAKRAADEAAARRQKELEEQRKYEALVLAETQKAEDALNALIEDQYAQRRAIEETSYQRKVDALKKSMEEEAKAHGTETELYQAYLSQMETLRRQHQQTMSDIAQDQFQNEKEIQARAIQQLEADNELYWQNRINELIAQGQEAGQVELQMLQDQLDNMAQYVDESDAEFYARRLQKQIAYNQKKEALNKAEMAMEKAKQQYMANIAGSISSLLETVAGENKAMVKASKVVALAEVAIKQGVAIAEAVASAAAGDPYTYALRVAAAIASTVAAMAEAIASINSVKLARGTAYVTGPGTSTSDSIPAMLSLGEGVVNARGNALFPGLVQAINDIGNGIGVPVQNQTTYTYNTVANAAGGITPDQIAEAMSQMPPAEVAVSEINNVNERVKVIENLRNY